MLRAAREADSLPDVPRKQAELAQKVDEPWGLGRGTAEGFDALGKLSLPEASAVGWAGGNATGSHLTLRAGDRLDDAVDGCGGPVDGPHEPDMGSDSWTGRFPAGASWISRHGP
ncbi:hypothetical protein GCM10010448_51260 [Streptomyces glomeratus]|uniref:Uncharacterized protein n=1 Tax=Streptomyces glomeratus TaxID=284452 RepID=A0ABP6LXR9_9ACTN